MAVLSVPADSIWNKWPVSQRRVIYDRPCYAQLYQRCQTAWESGCALVVVKGTPGIGKSFFLDYVLSKLLLLASKSVMVILGPRGQVHLYKNGHSSAPEEITLTDATTHNRAREVDHVLYDPQENALQTQEMDISMFCGKNVLIAMSPDPGNCSKILKDATQEQQLYMGPTSFEEAEDMRASCYPEVPADLLQTRYSKIGGIARYLFDDPPTVDDGGVDLTVDDVVEIQTAALNDIAQNPIRIDAGEVAAEFKNLWSLYHLQPAVENGGTNFRKYTIELVCEDVRAPIRDKLMDKDVNELWNLYNSTLERHGTLKGIRYEAYAHKKIMVHGVNLAATSLTTTGVGRSSKQIIIPASLPKINLSTNDLGAQFQNDVNSARALPTGGYLLPSNSNFPVVDSLFASPTETLSLQMKAGRSKPLSGPCASSIQAAAGGCLVFVVPDENIIIRKLGYSEGAGPTQWRHYRLVLKQP
mmetsp:Transcript_18652/g.43451  ORF Transcript_18652/g.43451 Transcript_18652/m.43451 type:complete len:471 (+) Transcript_18652:84-1496(+)